MNQTPTSPKLVDSLIISIFLIALVAPLLIWALEKDVFFSDTEKRKLQHFPEINVQQSITEFTHSFDSYFQDHFGLREWLISRYQHEASKRFGVSGVPNVIEGSEGWLFLSFGDTVKDLKGKLQFSKAETESFWNLLIEKEDRLKDQGIAYIFLIAPNKQSIYPEYLPDFYQSPSKKASRLDQLLAVKPPHGGESLLDIRHRIIQKKSRTRLYDKSDTHWNIQGAYLAHIALLGRVQELFPDVRLQNSIESPPLWKDAPGGDLAVMIGKEDTIIEQKPVLNTTNFSAFYPPMSHAVTELLQSPQLGILYSAKEKRPLNVLVLHDSFFEILKPTISESFGRVLYVTRYKNDATMDFFDESKLQDLITLYKPDLIIEELVERNLTRFFQKNGHSTE